MTEQLGRHATMVLLGSMFFGLVVGLLAWGPVLLDARVHDYADARTFWGIPNAVNVLTNAVLFGAALWGAQATRCSQCSLALRRAWLGFQSFSVLSAIIGTVYHLNPTQDLLILMCSAVAGGFAMLTLGMLAERIHSGFASRSGIASAVAVALLMFALMRWGSGHEGSVDVRPLLLMEALPLLLFPAGAVSLPGQQTRPLDWIVLLVAYGISKACQLLDHRIFQWTGWISGHSMMHLALAFIAGYLGYCAMREPSVLTASESSERSTSLYTSS